MSAQVAEKLVILIPTYNEGLTIAQLLEKLGNFRDLGSYQFDVLVIDDNSPDGTAQIVDDLQLSWVKILRRPMQFVMAC